MQDGKQASGVTSTIVNALISTRWPAIGFFKNKLLVINCHEISAT